MSFFTSIIQKIIAPFRSGATASALTEVASLVTLATPIVAEIAALTPNQTNNEIAAVFQKFGVPISQQILNEPAAQRGDFLLQLATAVLAAKVPNVATSILNIAVQLAVIATHGTATVKA
jgi:hypothetical protein